MAPFEKYRNSPKVWIHLESYSNKTRNIRDPLREKIKKKKGWNRMKRGEKTFIDPCLFLPMNDLLIQRDIYIYIYISKSKDKKYESIRNIVCFNSNLNRDFNLNIFSIRIFLDLSEHTLIGFCFTLKFWKCRCFQL